MDDRNAPPLNPLPPVVWLLALPMIGLEAAFSLGERGMVGGAQAIGWRNAAIQSYGIWPDYWRQQVGAGAYSSDVLLRFFTYPFLHIDLTQTIFAVVILLALGKFVGEIFRWWALLAVFVAAQLVGAMVYLAVPGLQVPLFGAYPGVYGLIGAFTFLLWVRLAGTGANQLRAFQMIGFLLLVQLIFGVFFGGGWEWVADLPGFVTGFFLSFVVSPGGFGRVRDRLRQR